MKKILFLAVLLITTMSFNAQTFNTLKAGESLNTGQKLVSANGKYMLLLQSSDGNLCIYTTINGNKGNFVWCSMEHGFQNAKLVMQDDGNLVVYDGVNNAKWASKTQPSFNPKFKNPNNKPSKLVLENDGELVLYSKTGLKVWSNNLTYLIIDKVWVNPNTVKFEFKSDGFMTREGEKWFKWTWHDKNNLIIELTDYRDIDKNKHAYFKFSKVTEKSMIMEYSQSGVPNYLWQNSENLVTN